MVPTTRLTMIPEPAKRTFVCFAALTQGPRDRKNDKENPARNRPYRNDLVCGCLQHCARCWAGSSIRCERRRRRHLKIGIVQESRPLSSGFSICDTLGSDCLPASRTAPYAPVRSARPLGLLLPDAVNPSLHRACANPDRKPDWIALFEPLPRGTGRRVSAVNRTKAPATPL